MVILIMVILGLAWGSFVNALTWRLHELAELRLKSVKRVKGKQPSKSPKSTSEAQDLSISTGRSMCPDCRHTLAAKDLIPVISWLMLRGKCRYCKKPISWQYPLVEVITALAFVFSYIFWPIALAGVTSYIVFVLWLVMLVILMALAVYDLRWRLLPNKLVLPLGLIAIAQAVIVIITADSSLSSFLNYIAGAVIGGGLFYLILVLSKGKWIGGGDVKLGLVLGLIVASPGNAALLLFLASLMGSLVALPLLFTKRLHRRSIIPFGPFLILATLVVVLFSTPIIDWYVGLITLR